MKKLIMCAFILCASFFSISFAHDGATGIVKQRMDMMSDVANSMKTLGQMIRGKDEYNPDIAESAALKIEKHAKHFHTLFPEGSTQEPSEALLAIWQDWEEFQKLLTIMENEANKLANIASTAKSAEEIKVQFTTLGKTCGMCHEKFRLKK